MPFWIPLFGGIALGVWGYKKVQEKKEILKELWNDPDKFFDRLEEEARQRSIQRGLKLLEEEGRLKREKEG